MKTKLNLLMIITLVVILAFTSTGAGALAIVETLTIGPEILDVAEYYTAYSQQLTANGGTAPYTFSLLSGTLPDGITLSGSGLLSGFPASSTASIPGIYPIMIKVQDGFGGIGSQDYNFVLDKGTPVVTLGAQDPIEWGNTFNIYAEVKMYDTPNSYTMISGTVAFTIDGIPVPGCGAVIFNGYNHICPVSMSLSPGEHTFVAYFTPAVSIEHLYTPVLSDSGTFTISPSYFSVAGTLFRDNNKDGEWDIDNEYSLGSYWTVNLDKGCNGTVDYTDETNYWSSYQFTNIPASYCYRITVVAEPGYQQTTQLEDFTLTGHALSNNIGFFYPTITLNPSQIPAGNVGMEYSQAFTADGGVEPYTFTDLYDSLPAGLTLSEEGILSGTPSSAGDYFITVQAEDANSATRYNHYELIIKTDGTFTFSSSSNPLAPGDSVIFTVTASGDAFSTYYDSQVPPMGVVTFYADGNPIEDCSKVKLNFTYDNDWNMLIGAYPATCTMPALETGTHQITATFKAYIKAFNVPTLTLTQEVQVEVLDVNFKVWLPLIGNLNP